jgi:hypothetical protein
MFARHENMLEKAHCIATKAKPVVVGLPTFLVPRCIFDIVCLFHSFLFQIFSKPQY